MLGVKERMKECASGAWNDVLATAEDGIAGVTFAKGDDENIFVWNLERRMGSSTDNNVSR